MAEREKVSGFRLPEETLKKLDELVGWGIIKNRTEGIIAAVDRYHQDNQYDEFREPFLYFLNRIVAHRNTVDSLKKPDAVFPIYLVHGFRGGGKIIDRFSPSHVNIRMQYGEYANTEVVIDVRKKRIIEEEEEGKQPDIFDPVKKEWYKKGD